MVLPSDKYEVSSNGILSKIMRKYNIFYISGGSIFGKIKFKKTEEKG